MDFSPVPRGNSGDIALSFFRGAKEMQKSPAQIAEEAKELLATCPIVESANVTGPYLNVSFTPAVFYEEVFKTPLTTSTGSGKTITVEFSGPNTNKPLHLGHMRNHALGIAVANLLEMTGVDVKRVNIINDRGVHICKSMLAYDRFGNGETPETAGKKGDHLVGDYYVKYETASKEDPSLKDAIQKMLVQWEAGDENVRHLWRMMSDWVLEGHAQTYARQGIAYDKQYYESDHYDLGRQIVLEGLEKGVFTRQENGSIVADFSEDGLDPKVMLRADGTTVYITFDMALAKLRFEDFHPDEMIYVVGDEQAYNFKVIFAALERLGILDKEHLHHLGYGMVNLPTGRMKSREGTVVDADDLMDTLSEAAQKEILTRHPDMPQDEAHTIAEQIMDGAWKFALLSTSPKKAITFDPEESIAFDGATGPYLQYAGVRIRSLLRKATDEGITPEGDVSLLGEAEKRLGAKILEFPEVLDKSVETRNPTYTVTYLLELAQAWSGYYAEHSVLGAQTAGMKKARLQLATKVLCVLEQGLQGLGITVPERM